MIDSADTAAVSCLQINLNHSKLAQNCVANKIKAFNTKQNNFIICAQEPYVSKQRYARKPKSCNTYCTLESIVLPYRTRLDHHIQDCIYSTAFTG